MINFEISLINWHISHSEQVDIISIQILLIDVPKFRKRSLFYCSRIKVHNKGYNATSMILQVLFFFTVVDTR